MNTASTKAILPVRRSLLIRTASGTPSLPRRVFNTNRIHNARGCLQKNGLEPRSVSSRSNPKSPHFLARKR